MPTTFNNIVVLNLHAPLENTHHTRVQQLIHIDWKRHLLRMKRDFALNEAYISKWRCILYPEKIFLHTIVIWILTGNHSYAWRPILKPIGGASFHFSGVARLPQRQNFLCFNQQQQKISACFFFNSKFSSCWWQVPCVFPVWKNGLPNFLCSGNFVFGLYITCTHTPHVTHTHAHTHAQYTMFSLKPLFSAPVVGFGCWVWVDLGSSSSRGLCVSSSSRERTDQAPLLSPASPAQTPVQQNSEQQLERFLHGYQSSTVGVPNRGPVQRIL